MGYVSKKNIFIATMAGLTKDDAFKNNRIGLLTSFGLVVGEIADFSDIENKDISTLNKDEAVDFAVKYYTESSFENYIKVNEDNSRPDDALYDGVITLKNVEVRGNITINLQFLTVFYDQVLGITFISE